MEKEHKKNADGDSGGAFNNLSDIHNRTQKALADWEQGLLDKIGEGAPEEVKKPEEPAKPKEVSMPYHVAQSMAAIDTYMANEGDRYNPNRTRGEFAQKLKDDYVNRLTGQVVMQTHTSRVKSLGLKDLHLLLKAQMKCSKRQLSCLM